MSKISVFIRVKGGICDQSDNKTVTILGNDSILLTRGTYESRKYTQFDGVFNTTQQEIYEKVCKTTSQDILNGYNVCIMAFGQSNAGKSYTIGLGDCDRSLDVINQPIGASVGLFPRITADLFKQISEEQISCNIEVSYTQIYRDCVYDLLDPEMNKLQGKMMFQPCKVKVGSASDVLRVVSQAGKRRVIAGTLMNEASSRSHVILTLLVRTSRHTTARLTVVDLAGSERVNRTNSHGTRLAEANSINKSLTALGKCIRALSMMQTQQNNNQNKQKKEQNDEFGLTFDLQKPGEIQRKSDGFIPYRDSLLTRLLQDSLSGNSKTTIIATISPLHCDYDESNSTLQFALRCTKVSMSPTANFALFSDPNQDLQQQKSLDAYTQQYQSNGVMRTSGEFYIDGGVGTVECQCPQCGINLKIYDKLETNQDIGDIYENVLVDPDLKQEYDHNNVQDLQKLIAKLQKENIHYKKITKELLGAYERVRGIESDIYQNVAAIDDFKEEVQDIDNQNPMNHEAVNLNTQNYDDINDPQMESSLPPLHPNTVDRLMKEGGYESNFLKDMQVQEEYEPQNQFDSQPYNSKSQYMADIRSKAQEISPTATNDQYRYNYPLSANIIEQHNSESEDEVTVPLVLHPPSLGQSSTKPITINKIKPYQPFYAPKQIKLSGKYPQLKYNPQSKALIETAE